MRCRFCHNSLEIVFVDLGMSPLANSYLESNELTKTESFFPLCSYVCSKCFLVQLGQFEKPTNIFSSYSYLSSYSDTWLKHTAEFVEQIISKLQLNNQSQVVEIASNDGYLLKNFIQKRIPCLGIEPAKNIAKIAEENSIPTINRFFSEETARELVTKGIHADLLIAFNVFPHVPNLDDFIKGLKLVLKPKGVLVIQFSAYLIPLIQKVEFDMIYHEHFSYFSLITLKKILEAYHLKIFDVNELDIHGGSLRIYITHESNDDFKENLNVEKQLKKELDFGLTDIKTYENFSKKVNQTKHDIQNFFLKTREENKKIVCYGAAAKGNTLLNFCEIGSNFIEYVVDRNTEKQGKFLPGTHIPIFSPEKVLETKSDYLVILAWNLKDEIMKQMSFIRNWNGKFVVLIPKIEIID